MLQKIKGYTLLGLEDSAIWNHYLQKLPADQQDIYFTPGYYKLYEDYGDGKAQCFVFEQGDDTAIYPFLLNSVNDLGYDLDQQYFDIQGAYGYNGVLSSTQDKNFITAFFAALEQFIKENNIIAEFTRFHPLIRNEAFSEGMVVDEAKKTVYVNISQEYDHIWNNNYSASNRNIIRKAIKNGIVVSVSEDVNDYKAFVDLYKNTMQDVGSNKYYYFSSHYFKTFHEHLKDKHKLIVAKKEGEIVGALIMMIFGRYAHSHLYGRLKSFSTLGTNNLVLDEAIKIAKNQGCSFLHLGGGTTNRPDDSLLKFKANFSKERISFLVGKKIHNGNIYKQVFHQWENRFPEKIHKAENLLLCYRY